MQIVASIFLALIPAFLWGYFFLKKNPEKRANVGFVFCAGALAVFPILIYKFLWQFFPWINAFQYAENLNNSFVGISSIIRIPLSVIITFMMVGVMEETLKFFAVKLSVDDKIKSIDDSIEFFIIAALGFAFTENILYFYSIWITHGAQDLVLPFLFRSSFSTLAHIIFSSIFGYYYGIAHFAGPILQEEYKTKKIHFTRGIFRIFKRKDKILFYEEKLLAGALIATGLHATFNILLEMKWNFAIIPFLGVGFIVVDYMFQQKENHKKYGKLVYDRRTHPHPKSGVFFSVKTIKT